MWFGLAAILLSAAPTVAQGTPAPAEPLTITWQVERPFSPFLNGRAIRRHREAAALFSVREQRTPVASAQIRLAAEADAQGWAARYIADQCSDAGRQLHTECRAHAYGIKHPKEHWITARVRRPFTAGHIPADELTRQSAPLRGICDWYFQPNGADLQARVARERCDGTIRLAVPYPDGGTLTVRRDGAMRAMTDVAVTDLFIVGLGDSFASGEGNPDVPVQFDDRRTISYGTMPDGAPLDGYPVRVGQWRTARDPAFLVNGARWQSAPCRRSAYGHQFRAALQLALDDPHRAVTFAGFACAGAEIIDGFFKAQKPNPVLPSKQRTAQLDKVAYAQCMGARPGQMHVPEAFTVGETIGALRDEYMLRCQRQKARRIDLLMLSIGGNDIGFTRILSEIIVDENSGLGRLTRTIGAGQTTAQTREKLNELGRAYRALNRALHFQLHMPWRENDRILITQYPPMTLRSRPDGGLEVCPSGIAGLDVFPSFRLSQQRAAEGERLSALLNDTIADAAAQHGWTLVNAHVREFIDRGLCAGEQSGRFGPNEDLRVPRLTNGAWRPFRPSTYRPYAVRRRLFRTPNDAFMTVNLHANDAFLGRLLRLNRLTWAQVAVAGSFSGAFHPNAVGHAVIADAVVQQARAVLARYTPDALVSKAVARAAQ
ncbi:MAG: hypothetical protein AAGF32_00975 [Pseudomonadota bacterium]